MKVLILLSTILLLGACATTPTMKSIVGTDVEKEGYKGRVKSVKVSSFTIMEKEGKQVRTPVRSYTPSTSSYTPSIKYDEKGNQTETSGILRTSTGILRKVVGTFEEIFRISSRLV